MYLKALEIQGFKSFPDRTVLTFGEDITAIVGPNGSGKSNLSDAIRWVMGEQSTRTLRGGKMEDVIFGGTAQRRQTGFAEVSLILDNTAHLLSREETEVMVTRRFYRSGESEYCINRRPVRLKDVNELFMDTGLGREGYSIIGQGRIDEILSVRSADRRGIFEEAAGISRFRHRKEEAERKLERTDQNLVRIDDRIAELELQVEPLREQSGKAKRFLVLRDEMRTLEISVWLDQLERLRAGNIRLETEYAEACRRRDAGRAAQEEAFAAAEACSARMQEKDVEADQIRRSMQARQTRAGELDSAVAVLRSGIRHNEESARRLEQELEQQEGREAVLSRQIAQRRQRLEEIEGQIGDRRGRLDRCSGEAEAAAHQAGELAQELELLHSREEQERGDVSRTREKLSALAAAAREVEDRQEKLRRLEQDTEALRTQAKAGVEQARETLRIRTEERDRERDAVRGCQLRLETRSGKADRCREQQMKLRMEENETASRVGLLTEMEKAREGFQKPVRRVLEAAAQGKLHGVHGPVAQLLKAPEAYALAVETALGGAMQNLVVDREEDGREIIRFLQRTDGGRVTVLPLSAARPAALREREKLCGEPGFVGVADQLITSDPLYRNVFSSLLGRVAVMEDLDTAIAVARTYRYAFRIVTLDGQMLNPGGSMTGGSAGRSAGILSRVSELERLRGQLAALREQRAEADRALEQAEQDRAEAAGALEKAQGQLQEKEAAVLRAETALSRAVQQGEDLERQGGDRQAEQKQLERRAADIGAETARARAQMAQTEERAAALQAEAEEKLRSRSGLDRQAADITAEVSRLNSELAGLEAEREATSAGLAELEQLRAGIAGDRSRNRELLADCESRNRASAREIEAKEQERAEIREENRRQQEQLELLREERLNLEGARNRASRESQTKNGELLRLQGEVARLEQQKATASLEEKQLLDRMWETYELSHEAARQQRVEIGSVSRATRRIAELKKQISALGNVNLGAIEEFERVNGRYTSLTEQRNDVAQSRKELEEILAGITGEMKTIFAREFAAISDSFSQTFQELFGGGRAALELEDPEDLLNCGIEIRVQPPGKTLKTITLLSGGEKAFVAIALCFAILKVRPTPFVVMDEIEAALDDSNVVRFASYMRTLAKKTQFIVITHRRGTMEEADVLYGVTMQEQGISRILTINLNDAEQDLHPESGQGTGGRKS